MPNTHNIDTENGAHRRSQLLTQYFQPKRNSTNNDNNDTTKTTWTAKKTTTKNVQPNERKCHADKG
eukprot:12934885-Prorocentrum_lima.AAC.1